MTGTSDVTSAHAPAERALAIVRASNRTLIRSTNEDVLLARVCRIAVELGEHRLAWVGYAEDDPGRTVRPVAFAGEEKGYLSAIRVSWADEELGRGPVGVAIRSGQPCVQKAALLPSRVEAEQRGFATVLALPLRDGDRTFGVLALYAADPGAFGPAEVDLLSELSDDLGFGIVTLRLRAERERLAAVVEQAVDAIVLVDADRRVSYANPAFLSATNRSAASVVGRPDTELARDILGPGYAATLLEAADARRAWLGELERPGPDGTLRHLEVALTPLQDERGAFAGEVLVSRDVSALRGAQAELRYAERLQAAQLQSLRQIRDDATLDETAQALCDALVELPFVEIAAVEAFVNGRKVQVVGLRAPEWLPIRAGEGLPDDLGRLNRGLARETAWAKTVEPADGPFMAALASHGVRALAFGPLVHAGHLDGGLIVATSDERFARVLVEKMPGLVSFSATTSALLAERLHARRALAERRETLEAVIAGRGFAPVFQPIVDLASHETVGYEALTRFDSGERPDRCFADAWAVGLGPEMEEATLAAAVAAARGLPAGLWLDLNVSPRLLADPTTLPAALRTAERPLVVEITEHEPVTDYAALREAVRSLGGGLRLAVDDAGAGVANFAHIVELRPDFVKLDISLVRGVNMDLGRQALVVAMHHFSRTAGCRLVAEGIETAEEAGTLLRLGVEFGQGFYLGRPEAAPEVMVRRAPEGSVPQACADANLPQPESDSAPPVGF